MNDSCPLIYNLINFYWNKIWEHPIQRRAFCSRSSYFPLNYPNHKVYFSTHSSATETHLRCLTHFMFRMFWDRDLCQRIEIHQLEPPLKNSSRSKLINALMYNVWNIQNVYSNRSWSHSLINHMITNIINNVCQSSWSYIQCRFFNPWRSKVKTPP